MTRHNMDDVAEKIQKVAQSYVARALTHILDEVEGRIARQLANAGKPQLAIERLKLTFFDLEARTEDLEHAQPVRQATPAEAAAHAREWAKDFPGSEPPTIWQLPMGQK